VHEDALEVLEAANKVKTDAEAEAGAYTRPHFSST
jgi:hypothetical protein